MIPHDKSPQQHHVKTTVRKFESMIRFNQTQNLVAQSLPSRSSSGSIRHNDAASDSGSDIASTSCKSSFEENKQFFEQLCNSDNPKKIDDFVMSKGNVSKLIAFFSQSPKQPPELINFARKLIQVFEHQSDELLKHGYSKKEIKELTLKLNNFLENDNPKVLPISQTVQTQNEQVPQTNSSLSATQHQQHSNQPDDMPIQQLAIVDTPNTPLQHIKNFFGFGNNSQRLAQQPNAFKDWVENPTHLTKKA